MIITSPFEGADWLKRKNLFFFSLKGEANHAELFGKISMKILVKQLNIQPRIRLEMQISLQLRSIGIHTPKVMVKNKWQIIVSLPVFPITYSLKAINSRLSLKLRCTLFLGKYYSCISWILLRLNFISNLFELISGNLIKLIYLIRS